uniref:Uncharacterized protein n=2 Tax=Panagrolaimus sp. JU765 TaxID=591449 RepID=A0AC34QTW6_9BILA
MVWPFKKSKKSQKETKQTDSSSTVPKNVPGREEISQQQSSPLNIAPSRTEACTPSNIQVFTPPISPVTCRTPPPSVRIKKSKTPPPKSPKKRKTPVRTPVKSKKCAKTQTSTTSFDIKTAEITVDETQRTTTVDVTQTATIEQVEQNLVDACDSTVTPTTPVSMYLLQKTQQLSPDMPKIEIRKKKSRRKESRIPSNILMGEKFLIGNDNQKSHKKKCYEKQRKRHRRTALPVIEQLRNAEFLATVDEFRTMKNVINCICEPQRFGCFKSIKFYMVQCCQHSGSFCYTFCCPPIPKFCFEKCAFWPPNRGYFFVHYDPLLPWSQEFLQNHKIIKANRIINIDENYSMGLEHSCCDRLDGVQPFVFQNPKKQFIAALLAKPRCYTNVKIWIIYAHPNGSDLSDLMTQQTPTNDNDKLFAHCAHACFEFTKRSAHVMPSPIQIADFLGCNIVFYDYPGYGISSGTPNEETFFETQECIIDYVVQNFNVPLTNIILWGYSIGTCCSIHGAMHKDIAGVMLFAPFASIMKIVKRHGRVTETTCCCDSFRSIDMITRVKCPILFAHGENDAFIPLKHSEALLLQAKKVNEHVYSIWCKDVTHDNLMNSSQLWIRVKKFIDTEIINASTLRATILRHRIKKDDQKQKKKELPPPTPTSTTPVVPVKPTEKQEKPKDEAKEQKSQDTRQISAQIPSSDNSKPSKVTHLSPAKMKKMRR